MNNVNEQNINDNNVKVMPPLENNKIISVSISLDNIKEDGTLYLHGIIKGTGTLYPVIVTSIDIYINGSYSYTNHGRLEGYETIYFKDIGVSNAAYNASHNSISVKIIAHGYNDVTSNTVEKNLPTHEDLSKEFINNEGLDKINNVYIFKIHPKDDNSNKSFLKEGSIYFTIDGSDPSNSSNENRTKYKDNEYITIPNVAGNYTIRVYHVVGNVNAELENYTFNIESQLYDAPIITYDNETNNINFSNFPTNSSNNLILQYEIIDVTWDIPIDTINLYIGNQTSLQVFNNRDCRIRARIIDDRGENYGKSLWTAYIKCIVNKIKYDTPIATIDEVHNKVTISNIREDSYLVLILHYNDGTEITTNNIVGDENKTYSFIYNKSGKAIFKLVNKNGANIGESNYGNIKFSINNEIVPDILYATPKLSINSTGYIKIDYNLYGDICDLYYELSLDNDNDGVYEDVDTYKQDSITPSGTEGYASKTINVGKQRGKIKVRLVNHENEEKGFSNWSDYLIFDFISEQAIISYPILNINYSDNQITCVFNRQSTENIKYTKVYYTIDESEPDETSNLAIINEPFIINVSNDIIIKYKAFYDYNGNKYWSTVESKYIKYNSSDKYVKPILISNVVKNYIDIIYSKDIETTKSLESIQYIIDVISQPFGTINVAEQAFARLLDHKDGRYSGDYLVLYSDETYSGVIDINDKGDNNVMNNYKYPTFQKGHWEFNYFRNNGTQLITENELTKIYTNIPYVDSNGNTIIATITLADLYKSFGITSTESGIVLRSDNRSLIYGKYIVARFIFNNDKKIKLQNVTFLTNNY